MTSEVKAKLEWLRSIGLAPEIVRVQSHVIVDCLHESGVTIRVVFPLSGSDRRGDMNFRSYVKRRVRFLENK